MLGLVTWSSKCMRYSVWSIISRRAIAIRVIAFLATMPRLIATIWLSLLLVGMQHHLVVHEIGHLGARLDRGSDVTLHKADVGAVHRVFAARRRLERRCAG